MSQQQRLIYLPLVGTILLCLLVGLYLAAWKRFSKSTPSNKVTKHTVKTPPDEALKYWTADRIRNALLVLLDHKTLDERERLNATTGSIHSTPLDWQDLSLLACKCILDISGCIWACSVRVVVWSSRDDYCATGEYKPRPRRQVLDNGEYA